MFKEFFFIFQYIFIKILKIVFFSATIDISLITKECLSACSKIILFLAYNIESISKFPNELFKKFIKSFLIKFFLCILIFRNTDDIFYKKKKLA
jgi:hypothetical protein